MTFPTGREAILWFLAPALLLGVAGWHSYQVAANDMTPWEGGGFGMFSTVDTRQARFVRFRLVTPDDTAAVRLPGHLDVYVERLRALPTKDRARGLADYLLEATWVATADTARADSEEERAEYRYLPSHETSTQPRAQVDAVEIAVWQYQFGSRPFHLAADSLVTAVSRRAVQ